MPSAAPLAGRPGSPEHAAATRRGLALAAVADPIAEARDNPLVMGTCPRCGLVLACIRNPYRWVDPATGEACTHEAGG